MPEPDTALLDRLVATDADVDVYRPRFLHLDRPDDRTSLHALVTARPGLTIYDAMPSQLRELMKTRHPSQRLSPDDLATLVAAHVGERPITMHGVWVYYPWSGRLVHLLDEAEFIELRTDRNRYKITLAERAVLAGQRVGIIGLSVGQSIAVTMAMERGFGELRLADFDLLELSNLNRIRCGVHQLGIPKVVAAAREIAEIDPFLRVICWPEGVNEGNIDRFLLDGGKLDILVDECDSLDIKFLARHRARAAGIPVVMDTSDRGLLDIERFDREPGRPLFHDLVGDVDGAALKGMSNEEKLPYILAIVGLSSLSVRQKASLIEVQRSISTWPQLASAVTLGGALGADACRRIALGQFNDSGRYFVDPEALVRDAAPSPPADRPSPRPAAADPDDDELGHLVERVRRPWRAGQVPPSDAQVGLLIEAAARAPSGGNCQPWHWVSTGGTLVLVHDRARSTSFLDVDDFASLVALGAATENLILRAHALDLEVACEPLPLAPGRRLVASFAFFRPGSGASVEPHHCDELAAAIPDRHTNRRLGRRIQLSAGQLQHLTRAAGTVPGAELHILQTDADLEAIEAIVAAADRIRLLHPVAHRELIDELRWTDAEAAATRDGIDLATLDLAPADAAALQVCRDWAALDLLRQWRLGSALEMLTRKAVRAASAVALLTMPRRRDEDYLNGGRAMERLWLAATRAEIAVQPLTTWVGLRKRLIRAGDGLSEHTLAELRALNERYTGLFPVTDQTGEIVLLRLAIAGPAAARSLRRPVGAMLSIR